MTRSTAIQRPQRDFVRRPSGAGRVSLAIEGVFKSFGDVVACNNVNLTVEEGEIRGLVGENGAGKSTLTAIVAGVYRADAGRVAVNGQYHRFVTPSEALKAGVSTVHQHPMLVDNLTVSQNVALAAARPGWRFRRGTVDDEVRRLGAEYGLELDPRAKVFDLSPPDQQRVEILIALHASSSIIILDEPTAILPPADIAQLIETMRVLAREAKTVIIISHKLEEVVSVADRVSVMRAGSVIDTVDRGDADTSTLARLMVGGEVSEIKERPATARGRVVLRATEVDLPSVAHSVSVKCDRLEVCAGEVLGVAGVDGNGQQELIETLSGLRSLAAGRIEFRGEDVTGLGVKALAERGLAHIPVDRRKCGLALPMSVAWNLGLHLPETVLRWRWAVDYPALRRVAVDAIRAFDIRGAAPETPVGDLSGGNQQKVMLARELATRPVLLLVSNPSVGLDVGAAAFVHNRLLASRDEGCAIVVVSSDLDELQLLSDRIVVMYRGQFIGDPVERPFSRHRLGLLMGGVAAQPNGQPGGLS